MAQFLLFLILLGGLFLGGRWLFNNPGEIVVNWLGYEVTLHVVVVAALLLAITLVITFLSITSWQVLTWGKRRRQRRELRTLQGGLKQLTLGVTALAMGDESAAQEALKKAALALPDDPLPQLLTAQLLQRQGKHEDARAEFKRLMAHEATAALATRRLIEQHVTAREWREATTLAEEARKEAPKDRWLVFTLLDMYARDTNTSAMLALTEGWGWQSPLTKEERHRYAALAHYLASTQEENPRRKEQALRHAVGYAPEFLPAIVAFAEVLHEEGQLRRARKWLREAWVKDPSPILIRPILNTIADESPRAQQRLLKPFLRGELSATHHLLAAHQAFEVDELDCAKTEVEAALALEESKAACSLMAEIEKELRGVDAANGWLARALDAPAAQTWVCHDCGAQHVAWSAHCSSCNHFDSLRYERPEARITSVELTPANAA
jgi:HemY protein